jgi:hypothetical protein
MRKRPENSWRQANSQGIWRKFGAKTESNVVQKTAERPGWERGLSGLSYYRFATTACDVTISMLCASEPGRPSPFTLAFDNSALTPVAIYAESTLYRTAVRARFEFFYFRVSTTSSSPRRVRDSSDSSDAASTLALICVSMSGV